MTLTPDSEHIQWPESEGIELSDDALFYGSVKGLEQLVEVARSTLEAIRQSEDVRLIVIEAWLLLDYAVRDFLLSGFGLGKLSVDSCDLRYHLLPTSFTGCLNILDQFTKAQSRLPEYPERDRLTMTAGFIFFLKKERPDDLKRLLLVVQDYYKRHHPGLADVNTDRNTIVLAPETAHHILGTPTPEYSHVNRGWLAVAQRLTKDWYKKARRLNTARNQAAHSFDRATILASMGLAGPRALTQLKVECEKLIATLVGVQTTQPKRKGLKRRPIKGGS